MQIIAEQKLTEFAERHPTFQTRASRWLELVKKKPLATEATGSVQQRETTFTVFNIGGNKARLIAIMRYDSNKLSFMKC